MSWYPIGCYEGGTAARVVLVISYNEDDFFYDMIKRETGYGR